MASRDDFLPETRDESPDVCWRLGSTWAMKTRSQSLVLSSFAWLFLLHVCFTQKFVLHEFVLQKTCKTKNVKQILYNVKQICFTFFRVKKYNFLYIDVLWRAFSHGLLTACLAHGWKPAYVHGLDGVVWKISGVSKWSPELQVVVRLNQEWQTAAELRYE